MNGIGLLTIGLSIVGFLVMVQIWINRLFKLGHGIKKFKLKIVSESIFEFFIDIFVWIVAGSIFGTQVFSILISLGINITTSLFMTKMIKHSSDLVKKIE